ncbi:hypothetical protein GPECTOR_8g128 [Gonium pectorale]|uniref:Uncharacterized protein n=1 Tax=Gonium pectorale TaxID=33097 RepID=A0A150GSA9_GONPE|nr:hypothetical protein GPECTOR_8g128 [Gonium pectorale]|eukprot:KXZ52735.1 hypothetical protein GPECTOR_8g128 [Gonium pectorale]
MPNSVLTTIMESLIAVSDPGQIVKMALPDAASSAAPAAKAAVGHTATAPGPAAASPSTLDPRWFRYYCDRMALRRNVRRFLKLYIPFLSRPSSMALLPGSSPAALAAAESRLGCPLPPELWELYRYRGGQAGGAFVTFADDMRLLALDELALEQPAGLSDLRARLAAMGRDAPAQLERPDLSGDGSGGSGTGGGGGAGSNGQCPTDMVALPMTCMGLPTASGPVTGTAAAFTALDVEPDSDSAALVVAANHSSSRRLLVTGDGQVYLARGLSVTFFAPSVASMIQKLLN